VPRLRTAGLVLASLAIGTAAAPAGGQGLPPLERAFASGATVRVYGQINQGILAYDDGNATDTYGLIDNANSGTRFGALYARPFGPAWEFGTRLEFGYTPYSTSNVNQENPSDGDWGFDNDNIRWIDFSFANERAGTVFLGQGAMATDGIAELDLSGTGVIGYSSVADSAAAQLLRYTDPDFDDGQFGPEIGEVFANYDGGRLTRIRYDTPDHAGFSAAFAFGRDLLDGDGDTRELNQYDAALLYATEVDAFAFEAGVGYYGNDDDVSVWAGSASGLHTPTGLNLTFAAGTEESGGASGSYWYGKLGILRDVVAWGPSAAALDYYSGDDIYTEDGVELFDAEGNPVLDDFGNEVAGDITSSSSESWGLMLVQGIDAWNTELWLTFRSYEYSDNFASYEDGQAVFGGARFRF
jgi:hypothetical protein